MSSVSFREVRELAAEAVASEIAEFGDPVTEDPITLALIALLNLSGHAQVQVTTQRFNTLMDFILP